MTALEYLKSQLAANPPVSFDWNIVPGHYRENALPEAAVLIPVTDAPEPELILTLRSQHLRSHSGEVAFPGGKQDVEDASLLHTALRETEEEIGLSSDFVEVLGQGRPRLSKQGMKVTPFVGIVPAASLLTPNLDELDEIFRVPLSWLANPMNVREEYLERDGRRWQILRYLYQGYDIWGLTSIVIADLVNLVYESGIHVERNY